MGWVRSGCQKLVVFLRLCLGTSFFVTYINIDLGLSNFVSKFADDTKIRNAALSEQDKRNLEEDFCKLYDWSEKWKMPFNINKSHILQIGSKNGKMDYEICVVKIKNVQ